MTNIFTDSSWIIQIIGFVAVGFSFAIFQFNKRTTMLRISMCGQILYAIHFMLLGAMTGSVMNLIGAVRSYLFAKFDGSKKPIVLFWSFIATYVVATILTWQGLISLLPMIGMITGTIAFWQSTPRYIRLIGLISPPLWFTYNYISGSYAGMFAEIILLSSNLIGIYRFDIKSKLSKIRL